MDSFEHNEEKFERLSEQFKNGFLTNNPVQFQLSPDKIDSLIREIDIVLKNE